MITVFNLMTWICFFPFRAVPKRLKDKLVSYILVLALMIDEFSLDCSVIMRDLKFSMLR